MTTALLISNLVLWILVAGLAVAVLALARQVGLLHDRIAPVGALVGRERPAVGEEAPVVEAVDLEGRPLRVGGPDREGRSTLLFFAAPGCPVCREVLPVLPSLARAEGGSLRVLLAGEGSPEGHRRLADAAGLPAAAVALSRELAPAYGVGRLPHAVLLDGAGRVRARGLVNTREHLESLFEARDRGVATLADLPLAAPDRWREPTRAAGERP